MKKVLTICKRPVRAVLMHVQRKRYMRRLHAYLQRVSFPGRLQGISDVRAAFPDFDQTVQKIRNAGTNSLPHFRNGYQFEGGLRLQQNPAEFAALCAYLKTHGPCATYLEIGTAGGGTCRFLSEAVGFNKVYSIDDGTHPDACYQADNLRHVPNLQCFVGDSHSMAAQDFLQNCISEPVDIVLIDGDHSYCGVWQDVQLVLKVSRPGTLLVFHDTVACRGVEQAWLRSVREKLIRPLAEYVGDEAPLGIGVGEVL